MGRNLNPGVNIAGARIKWDFDTGAMTILSQYGFESITDIGSGKVRFVMDDASADKNIFPTPTPCYLPNTNPVGSYVPCVGVFMLNPEEGAEKAGFDVVMWSVQPSSIGVDLVPFSLTVQELSPGFQGPDAPGPAEGGGGVGVLSWATLLAVAWRGEPCRPARTPIPSSIRGRGGRRKKLFFAPS